MHWLKTKLANRKPWKWKRGAAEIQSCALGNLNLGEALDGVSLFKCINLCSVLDGMKLGKAYNLNLTKHSKESQIEIYYLISFNLIMIPKKSNLKGGKKDNGWNSIYLDMK